jgi:hypothetical protein
MIDPFASETAWYVRVIDAKTFATGFSSSARKTHQIIMNVFRIHAAVRFQNEIKSLLLRRTGVYAHCRHSKKEIIY